MIDMKNNPGAPAFVIAVSALLAGPSVALQDRSAEVGKCGSVANAAVATEPIPVVRTGSYPVWILLLGQSLVPGHLSFLGLQPSFAKLRITAKSLVDAGPVMESLVPWLKAHVFNRRVIALLQASVPGRLVGRLGLSAIRMVPALVGRIRWSAVLVANTVAKARLEALLAAATANPGLMGGLVNHAVHCTGKRK